MNRLDKKDQLKELQRAPGVGPRIAEDLINLGITRVSDLQGRDPEELYRRLCEHEGKQVDRCMLYVFRCAVYFASASRPESRLLQWWAWKDNPDQARSREG